MTPNTTMTLKSKMRLAFSQACVNFPSLNVLPISSAVYQVYAYESYCIGSTFTLLDEGVPEDVLELTREASVAISAREDHQRLMGGLGPDDRKLAKVYCYGLDPVLTMQMLNYARQYGVSPVDLRQRRHLMLVNRRNQLANEFTEHVIERARQRLLSASWGETYYAESRTD